MNSLTHKPIFNLAHLAMIFGTIIFLYQAFNLIRINPQQYMYADWQGHLDKAKKLDWFWQSGWDTTFWGGYPTATYPSFAHVVLRFWLEVTKSDRVTAAIATLTSLSFQCFALFKLSAKLSRNKKLLQPLYYLSSLAMIYYLPSDLLGSFAGTVMTGGFPASLALSFFLLFLSNSNPYLQAFLFGLTILTHTITAFLIGLIIGIQLAIHIAAKVTQNRQLSKLDFIPLLGGIIIGSPWWLAIIDPSFSGVATNLTSEFSYSILVVGLLCIAGMIQTNQYGLIFISLILSTFLSSIPFSISTWLQQHGVSGIHFYRFQVLAYITYVVAAAKIVDKTSRKDIKHIVFMILSAACLIGLSINNYKSPHIQLAQSVIDLPKEPVRILDISDLNNVGNFYRYAEHALTSQQHVIGTVGMFYESSQHGPIYYSFARTMNAKSYANGTYSTFFRDYSFSSNKLDLKETAQLLGISYISYFSPGIEYAFDAPTATIGGIIAADPNKPLDKNVNWYLAKINNSTLISSLDTLPQTNSTIDLGIWWFDQKKHDFIARQSYSIPLNINLNLPSISNITIKPTAISFHVDSKDYAPVIVKFTYNRYWQNQTDPNQQPIWVTPGYMLVFAKGDTTLIWHPPLYISLAWIISFFTLIYCLYCVTQKKSSK